MYLAHAGEYCIHANTLLLGGKTGFNISGQEAILYRSSRTVGRHPGLVQGVTAHEQGDF